MMKRIGFGPFLVLLAGIALALRLIGIDWDQGLYLHPDERFVVWVTTDLRWPQSLAQFFDSATSPLNPYNTQHGSFVYGTFPSFLVKAIAGIFDMDTYGELHLVGRAVNAVADTGTVVLTAVIGRRFFGKVAGLLAGLLLAFTPLFIQSAHYFTVDTIAVFFVLAAFACVLRSWDRESIGWMALAGLMIGLAGASKPNYLISLAFLGLPMLELVRLQGWRVLIPEFRERVYPAIAAALTGGFVAFWTFRFAQPYAFSGPQWWNISLNQQWLDDLAYWRSIQTGLVDMKPSIQWIERTPVVYILQNLLLWGMGVALGTVALIALGLACWRILRSKTWPSWWFIGVAGWCIGSIVMFGTGIAQNQRYLMHIYPFLLILAAGLLIELRTRLPRNWVGQLLITSVVVYTVIFGLGYASLYVRPITRIEASDWIYENVPPGSVLSNEYWDDALPQSRPGQDRSAYIGMTLDLYGDESGDNSKVTTLVGQLSQVDYIVLSSDRIISSVVRQPERYPVAVRYYEMLLSGELGFEPVASFRQGPEFLGIEWDDRTAEESLTVYEHPQVRIFKKTDQYNAQFVFTELDAAWGYGGYHYIPGDPLPSQMLMSDSAKVQQAKHGNWSDQVADGWWQQHPLISLWLGLQIVGIAAWPLTWRAFRKLPDMGWMLAKGIGLFGMSAMLIAMVSWRSLLFDRGTIAISLLILLATGLAAERCVWDGFVSSLRRSWKAILAGEAVLLGAIALFGWIRSMYPVLPDHNLMQFSAVMRSVSLPPTDPWLSGGALHIHWAGLVPWAAIGKLFGLPPFVAYNLAVIGILSVIAGIVWSLVASRSKIWVAILAAITTVLGSSFAFAAGLVPMVTQTSVGLTVLATVLAVAVLLHVLHSVSRNSWLSLLVIAILAGAVTISAGWGIIIACALTATGYAIRAWERRSPSDPWWPMLRVFVLKLVATFGLGIAIWYPAWSAFKATNRNLISTELWTITTLRDEIAMVILLLVVVIVGIGAANVFAAMSDEGPPGIAVTAFATLVVVALFVSAWRWDAAVMLLLLISMLAITAIWHWQDEQSMLWSMALVLIATLLMTMAQTRRFHADANGSSIGLEMVPVSWLLLIIAVALALAHAIRTTPFALGRVLTAGSVLVGALLWIPAIDHFRAEGFDDRQSLANPAIIVSQGELEAATWMQQNLSGNPTILTVDGPTNGSTGTISAITGFPTVLGSSPVERSMRPGWEGMVQSRSDDIAFIYSGLGDWNLVSPVIEQYGIHYIVVGAQERLRFGDQLTTTANESDHLELVFASGDVFVYQVQLSEIEQPD